MNHTLHISELYRHLPICRVNDKLYIAAFILLGDVELTVTCAKALLELAPVHDYLITLEAKSIPLIHEMARQSGQNKYFVIRKSPKLYMRGVIQTEVNSITTEHTQKLFLDKADADMISGKRMLLIDDVISTGESMSALEDLVLKSGGIVAGRMAVLAEGAAAQRKDIIYIEKLPLFSADGSIKEYY